MNALLALVASVLVAAQLCVPRRLVLVPLLIAACHVPLVVILPPSFSIVRLVMLACLLRAAATGALVWRVNHSLDRWLILWSGVLVFSAVGHTDVDGNPWTLRLGLVFDIGGTYLCAKAYLRTPSDIAAFTKYLAAVLVPLALLMLAEKITGHNSYEALGATFHMVRDGRIRAGGPFANAILAGTAGATLIPLMFLLFRRQIAWGVLGVLACCTIVYSSSSSGPFMTLFFALWAMALWRWRSHIAWFRGGAVAMIILLHFVMNDPVWYLMARVDLTGGSVGYHRAELITQALNRIGDWWLMGTDYTRDWIPYGVPWSQNHADITNHYLKMGILGGLPVMLIFIAILIVAFRSLGRTMRAIRAARDPGEFTLWAVGAALAAYCFAFLGVSPYDQSYILIFALIGAIPGLSGTSSVAVRTAPDPAPSPPVKTI